jgi:CRISPR system Cascade subunit CasB
MKPCNFTKDEDLKKNVLHWWERLQEERGVRAELSRSTSEEDVFLSMGFYHLKYALRDYKIFDPALARVAAVLSRIRRDRDGESFGMLLSEHTDERRVKRLLRMKGDRLIREFCTLVKIMKAEAPVVGTADLVYWWELRHPNRDFLYDFYSKKEMVEA